MITTIYKTEDGKTFKTMESALAHEKSVTNQAEGLFHRYITAYSGQQLLKKHRLEEKGVWRVEGEDPNCDFGGPHHRPHIGDFEGKLENVIEAAVMEKEFWTWGGGGTITKIEVKSV
jgi:hypothetical protein